MADDRLRQRLTGAVRRGLQSRGLAVVGAGGPRHLHRYRLHRVPGAPTVPDLAEPLWIDLSEIVLPPALSFAEAASIPHVRAAEQLLSGSEAAAREVFAEHYRAHQPQTVAEVFFGPDEQCRPLSDWPAEIGFLCWGIWLLTPGLLKAVFRDRQWWGDRPMQYHGPQSPSQVDERVRRLGAVLDSLREHGYHPERFADGLVLGYFVAHEDRHRFVAIEGQHRLAALAALGHDRVACGIFPSHLPVLTTDSVERYAARRGVLPPPVARRVLETLLAA